MPGGWIFLCSLVPEPHEQMREPSLFETLIVPAQGSCTVGLGFCVWSLFVHEAHVSRHVALIVQLVQVSA
jgi:hypothetical protein